MSKDVVFYALSFEKSEVRLYCSNELKNIYAYISLKYVTEQGLICLIVVLMSGLIPRNDYVRVQGAKVESCFSFLKIRYLYSFFLLTIYTKISQS